MKTNHHVSVKNNIISLYPKESRNNIWYIVSMLFMISFMLFYLFFPSKLIIAENFLLLWILLFALTLVITITNFNELHSSNYIIASYLISIPMILNYILFKLYIYIPNYIIFILSISLSIIYGVAKEFHFKKYFRIILVLLCVCIFFSINYYLYSIRIIKDSNLEIIAKKSIGMNIFSLKPLGKDNLLNIDTLKIKNVYTLEGLESVRNLNTLDIDDSGLILDYSPITKLNNLKTLRIYNGDLDILSEVDFIEHVENFNLIYPKTDSLKSLPLFPNVTNLTINFSNNFDLSTLKNFPKVKEFSLCLEGPLTVDGLEVIHNLETLNLSYAYIPDYSRLFNIPTLKTIKLDNCYIPNIDDFIKKAEAKGIKVIM